MSSSGIIPLPNVIQNQSSKHDDADADADENDNHRDNKRVVIEDIQDFVKQPNVVIAVKIHDVTYVKQLKQSLCLLTVAYNNRLQYDILIFVTVPLPEEEIQILADIVHPARLVIENDKFTSVQQHLQAMTAKQREILLERCGIKNETTTTTTMTMTNQSSSLQWWTRCCEQDSRNACMPLRYNWQAEFRSKHMWRSPTLAKYQYMMWLDSDAFATRIWLKDPIAFAIRNDLKMLFANFPQGETKGMEVADKVYEAYGGGESICTVQVVDGHLEALKGVICQQQEPRVPQIHGFFYILDLDFYRSPENLNWYDIMIGNAKFSRKWDDQLAVTIPAAMRAPNESWSMVAHGLELGMYHNSHFDGNKKRRFNGGGYLKWYAKHAATQFPESIETCRGLIRSPG